jgi:hypothetical protein
MIYKYEIKYGQNLLALPLGSRIMATGWTNNQLVVWADTSEAEVIDQYVIYAVFTGYKVPNNCKFIGTVVADLVYHVFEEN